MATHPQIRERNGNGTGTDGNEPQPVGHISRARVFRRQRRERRAKLLVQLVLDQVLVVMPHELHEAPVHAQDDELLELLIAQQCVPAAVILSTRMSTGSSRSSSL